MHESWMETMRILRPWIIVEVSHSMQCSRSSSSEFIENNLNVSRWDKTKIWRDKRRKKKETTAKFLIENWSVKDVCYLFGSNIEKTYTYISNVLKSIVNFNQRNKQINRRTETKKWKIIVLLVSKRLTFSVHIKRCFSSIMVAVSYVLLLIAS